MYTYFLSEFFNKRVSSRMYLLFCVYQFIGPFFFNLLLVFVRFDIFRHVCRTNIKKQNHEIPYKAVDWGPSWPMTMISRTLLDCGTSLTGRSLLFRPCLDLIPSVTAHVSDQLVLQRWSWFDLYLFNTSYQVIVMY